MLNGANSVMIDRHVEAPRRRSATYQSGLPKRGTSARPRPVKG